MACQIKNGKFKEGMDHTQSINALYSVLEDERRSSKVYQPSNEPSLSPEQQRAVNNSINYIKNAEFDSKERIDADIITIKMQMKNMGVFTFR